MGDTFQRTGGQVSRRRKYNDEFRAEALKKMDECSNVSALARELGIRRKFLYQWRDRARLGTKAGMPCPQGENPETAKLQRKIADLERIVGRQSAELDFFKGALRKVEARRQKNGITGGAASTSKSS
jgi:transposase